MFPRLVPACLALFSVALGGCVFDDESPASGGGTPAEVRLQRAGSEAALVAHLNAGLQREDSGNLLSQRMVGAPAEFAGREVRADGGFVTDASAGGGEAAGGAGGGVSAAPGGVMAGDDGAPADDGLDNEQVNGVEEPDVVKSDGEYLYVAQQPDAWVYPLPVASPGIEPEPLPGPVVLARRAVPRDGIVIDLDGSDGGIVIDVDIVEPGLPPATAWVARYRLDAGTPSVTPLPSLELTGLGGYVSRLQLLLQGEGDQPRLVAMGQSAGPWHWDRWFAGTPYEVTQETRLWVFDTSDPENIGAPLANVVLKGDMVNSRRVGNHLYLVTRYAPTPGTDPVVPQLTIDSTQRPLVAPADCLVPAGDDGFPVLTFIVAIDLVTPGNSHAACFAGEVYTMYMSRESLYLAAQRYNPDFDWNVGTRPLPAEGAVTGGEGVAAAATAGGAQQIAEQRAAPVHTVIHRFALNDGEPQYTGSGKVAGGFTGWMGTGSQPQWRFHERNGLLYVLTSWWDVDDLHHHLYVLAPDDDGGLVVAATLPNAAHPQPIGKPREDIFAMRYVGERAYVVTFRQTDPLYVIDLADPLAPVVAGELELPGFSAYLHPVGDDWLLGIGRGADGRSGVEANVFDVRDPAAPRVHRNQPICASCNAPLLTDYHAIAVQRRAAAATRVALPLQSWEASTPEDWRPLELSALLEVQPATGDIALVGALNASREATALGRVLLIAEAVFMPQLGGVSFGRWPAGS